MEKVEIKRTCDSHKEVKQKVAHVLRWIAILPASITSSWLIYMVAKWAYIWSARCFIEPDSLIASILPFFAEATSHGAMGAAATYIAARIAPIYKLHVATAFSGITLILFGACLLGSLLSHNYLTIIWGVCMCIGSITITYSIYRGDIEICKETSE